eukprot:1115515-Prymnesium_polylepis.3
MFGGDRGAHGVGIGGCDWPQRISTFRTAILQKIEARARVKEKDGAGFRTARASDAYKLKAVKREGHECVSPLVSLTSRPVRQHAVISHGFHLVFRAGVAAYLLQTATGALWASTDVSSSSVPIPPPSM